ncbi:MAG TPA: hypothetical protein VHT52_17865 [Stellaceae bacterium]|jgi:hypothetical protein|nr:hypothetical protein [Stellaceae bacterium]
MAGGGGYSVPFAGPNPAQEYQYLNQQGTLGAMGQAAGTGMGPGTGEALQIGAAGQRAATQTAGTVMQEDALQNQANALNMQAKGQQIGGLGGLAGSFGGGGGGGGTSLY